MNFLLPCLYLRLALTIFLILFVLFLVFLYNFQVSFFYILVAFLDARLYFVVVTHF